MAIVETPVEPPAPADNSSAHWRARIAEVVADQARMKGRQAAIEAEIAANYGGDNAELETEYARLNARYNASGKVIETYQRQEREAIQAELLATFAGQVERFSSLVSELTAYERDEWPGVERAYLDGIARRRKLRQDILAIQQNASHQLQLQTTEHFPDDPAAKTAISRERERMTQNTPIITRDDGREVPSWHVVWKQV